MIIKKILVVALSGIILVLLFGCTVAETENDIIVYDSQQNDLIVTIPNNTEIMDYQTELKHVSESMKNSEIKVIVEKMQPEKMQIHILEVKNTKAVINLINNEVVPYENTGLGSIENTAMLVDLETKYVQYKDIQYQSFGIGQIIICIRTVLIELDENNQIITPYHFYVYNREFEFGAISSFFAGFSTWANNYYEYEQ